MVAIHWLARRRVGRQPDAGGKARAGAGFFYEPTVIAGARQEDEIVKREVFGPVLHIVRWSGDPLALYGAIRPSAAAG